MRRGVVMAHLVHVARSVELRLFLFICSLAAGGCLVQSVCYDDADCPVRQHCAIARGERSGSCLPRCEADVDCARGSYCDVASGRCESGDCLRDADCVAGFSCEVWRCTSTTPLRCPPEMVAVENRFCIDAFEAARPDADSEQPGSDESHATSRAGVLPWQVESNAAAHTACVAVGKKLCSEGQWLTACRGSRLTTYAYGDGYDPVICNGIDKYCACGAGTSCADRTPCPFAHCYQDCGAPFALDPTGSNPGCENGWAVFDLNGNLWEHVLDGDDTRVRGGAFNCLDSQQLHRCDYIPTSWTPSARGFRCCSPGLPQVQGGSAP